MDQLPQQADALIYQLYAGLDADRRPAEPRAATALGGTRVSYDDEKLVIERPWFDTAPVFIAVADGRVRLARRWSALAPFTAVDLNYVQDYLRYQTPFTRRTFCSGVGLLRNGERWIIAGKENLLVTTLPSPPEPSDQSLLAILEREIVAAGPDAVFHLSSGLDSSLLAIVARRLHATVRAATFRTRGRGASQELDIVQALAEQFRIELDIYDLTEIDLWKEGINLIEALPYPIAHPSHLVRYLLDRRLARRGVETIVTGRGPDELLAGYEVHGPKFKSLDAYERRITCTSEMWIEKLFQSPRRSESRVERAGLVENGELSLTTRLRHDLHAIFEAWNMIDMELARCLEVSYVNPFLARDAAVLMFSRPDSDKLFNGYSKYYLRRNFAEWYPDYVLRNPKMGLTIDIREYLGRESVASLVRRLYDESSFGQRFLRREAILTLVEDTLSGRTNYGWQIWSLYLCQVMYAQLFND
ncbi:MAG: hypothetical protein JO328_04905 [Hyphomicrobiales bacterium]|nr:hypothetical protein [Hyphomicrobiales bacterium]MBV8825565.1 hypothetical protein [Hyphomicrobiales bacterium]MBV9430114.1 hypothetical protein [Bradyrhizobiaceae bacterium]